MRTLAFVLCLPCCVLAAEPAPLFDGKTFAGWEGDTKKTWRIEEGVIVGGSLDEVVPRNEFLCTTKTYGDFELLVKFKLLGDPKQVNAGVQIRTKRIPDHHEVSGYQADIGQGYWGALYDESRRNKVLAAPDPKIAFATRYVPTMRGLLATYDFLDLGKKDAQGRPVYENVNQSTADRNSGLLDLNDGLDLFLSLIHI